MTTWVPTTSFYVSADNTKFPTAMFGNSYTGTFQNPTADISSTFAWGAFGTYDMTTVGVSSDARFVAIGGITIITGGADLFFAFRAPGSVTVPSWNYYQWQLLSASTTLGERSVAFDIIPLSSGCFECAVMALKYPDDGTHPGAGDGSHSVGWNISVKGWGR